MAQSINTISMQFDFLLKRNCLVIFVGVFRAYNCTHDVASSLAEKSINAHTRTTLYNSLQFTHAFKGERERHANIIKNTIRVAAAI